MWPPSSRSLIRWVPPAWQACPRSGNQDASEFARFPDPLASAWLSRLNDGGVSQPGRNNNCLDCSLAVVSTWFGRPSVSAARVEVDGTGEGGGPLRATQWLREDWEDMARGAAGLDQVADRLRDLGSGSAAVIWTGWAGEDGSHAWNAVNVSGEVIWVDGQTGKAGRFPYSGTSFCKAIFVASSGEFT